MQYLLLAAAGLGVLWTGVSAASWLGGGLTGLPVLDEPVFLLYSLALVGASLLAGWLTGVGCANLVEVAAAQRREQVEKAAQSRVCEIAAARVVAPVEQELERYRAYRTAFEVADTSTD